jgi:hypothetical protein
VVTIFHDFCGRKKCGLKLIDFHTLSSDPKGYFQKERIPIMGLER